MSRGFRRRVTAEEWEAIQKLGRPVVVDRVAGVEPIGWQYDDGGGPAPDQLRRRIYRSGTADVYGDEGGNCVTRAIAIAAGIDYDEVWEAVEARCNSAETVLEHPDHGVELCTLRPYLWELGFEEISGEISWDALPRDRTIILDSISTLRLSSRAYCATCSIAEAGKSSAASRRRVGNGDIWVAGAAAIMADASSYLLLKIRGSATIVLAASNNGEIHAEHSNFGRNPQVACHACRRASAGVADPPGRSGRLTSDPQRTARTRQHPTRPEAPAPDSRGQQVHSRIRRRPATAMVIT